MAASSGLGRIAAVDGAPKKKKRRQSRLTEIAHA